MMTMDEFKREFAAIEKEMMEADPQNEFLQPPLWERLTELMSADLPLTISFLENATEDEVDTAFCVVEDVAQRFDSQEYIDCLYKLCDKYPNLGMRSVAKLAEAFMNEYRMEKRRKKVLEDLNRRFPEFPHGHIEEDDEEEEDVMKPIKDVFHAFLVEGAVFEGKYGFARIWGTNAVPRSLVPFDIAMKSEKHDDSWVHFYREDYLFLSLWQDPKSYLPILKRFPGVISPDFSKYRNMPLWQQIEAQGRAQALGYWLEKNGVPVIPNVRWGDERSYEFCFDGISPHKTVAVGSLGCFKDRTERSYFELGLKAMIERLCPERILVYGRAPEPLFAPLRAVGIEVIAYPCYYESLRKKGQS